MVFGYEPCNDWVGTALDHHRERIAISELKGRRRGQREIFENEEKMLEHSGDHSGILCIWDGRAMASLSTEARATLG